MTRCRTLWFWLTASAVLLAGMGLAGSLDAPAPPTSPGSAMYTLSDIYDRLVTGAAGSKRAGGFAEPGSGPGASTRRTLDEVMDKAPAVDANGANPAEVLAGKAYWGLTPGSWGPTTGTMANVGTQNFTPGVASQAIAQGYHDGAGLVGGDPDLVSGNIRQGADIFGVAGAAPVVDTSSGNATAGEILPGRKAWVGGAEITGAMAVITGDITPGPATQTIPVGFYDGQASVVGDADLVSANVRAGTSVFGVVGSASVVDTSPANATGGEILLGRNAWVNGTLATGTRVGGVSLPKSGFFWMNQPRWFKNGDGTVTDCKTGLVWLSNVPHIARPYLATTGAELDCMRWLYSIRHGTYGLTDQSQPGDWGMPTLNELTTLFLADPPGQEVGSLSSQAFDNPYLMEYYWTATPIGDSSGASLPDKVYVICMRDGSFIAQNKMAGAAVVHYVWPIRRVHRW